MTGLTLALLLTGCTPKNETAWTLVFEDTFDGEAGTAPNPANWTHDVGGDGWGNSQLEFNTDRTENASLDGNGTLVITARKEDYEGNTFTSARLKTQGLQEFAYGRIEARIKLPAGKGLWPAFWMLGGDFPEIGWPGCGEIDILELRGETPEEWIGTVHGPGYSGGAGVGGSVVYPEALSDDYHLFAIEWDPGHIAWFVDDALVHTVHAGDLPDNVLWVYDHPFFLLLNLAVGGHFVQEPDDDSVFPAEMRVDHVKVFSRTTPLEPADEES